MTPATSRLKRYQTEDDGLQIAVALIKAVGGILTAILGNATLEPYMGALANVHTVGS